MQCQFSAYAQHVSFVPKLLLEPLTLYPVVTKQDHTCVSQSCSEGGTLAPGDVVTQVRPLQYWEALFLDTSLFHHIFLTANKASIILATAWKANGYIEQRELMRSRDRFLYFSLEKSSGNLRGSMSRHQFGKKMEMMQLRCAHARSCDGPDSGWSVA